MPSPESSDLPHKALLFEFAGTDDDGETQVSGAVELDPAKGTGVRWVAKKSQVVDAQGNVKGTDVTVMVDREITVGSIMWRGGFDDIVGTADLPDSDFYEVVSYEEADDVRGRETARQVKLIRHTDTLPAIV